MTIINQPDEPTSLKYTNMNKLLFKEGGQPFYLDDLEFMQESTADVLKAICSGMKLGEKHILLSGQHGNPWFQYSVYYCRKWIYRDR